MKHIFYFVIIMLSIACGSDKSKNESTQEDRITLQKSLDIKNNVHFQDKSRYSKTFVSELTEKGYTSPIKIIDDYLFFLWSVITAPLPLSPYKSS